MTRSECMGKESTCVKLSCPYHKFWVKHPELYTDLTPWRPIETKHIVFKGSDRMITHILTHMDERRCVLREIEQGGNSPQEKQKQNLEQCMTLQEIGDFMGISRQAVHQIIGDKKMTSLAKKKYHYKGVMEKLKRKMEYLKVYLEEDLPEFPNQYKFLDQTRLSEMPLKVMPTLGDVSRGI